MSGSSGGENLDLMAKVDVRIVVGTTNEFGDEVAARQAIAGLHLGLNARNERVKVCPITLSELVDHYRQRELKPANFISVPQRTMTILLSHEDRPSNSPPKECQDP
jgi:hypothetical protein